MGYTYHHPRIEEIEALCVNRLHNRCHDFLKLRTLALFCLGSTPQRVYRTAEGCITKTCLYNFDPFKPHFYIVKLGFTRVYIIFLISAQKHRLWVRRVLTSSHSLCFGQKHEKYKKFLSEIFQFLEVKFSIYLNRRVLVMPCQQCIHRSDAVIFGPLH